MGVDVGQDQLHAQLRQDARVVCLEGLNARTLTPSSLQEAWEAAGVETEEPPAGRHPPENPYRWMSGDGEVSDYDDSDDVRDEEVEAELARNAVPQAVGGGRRTRRQAALANILEPVFDLITGDLSFISLTLVLPALVPLLAPGGQLLMLVKPQFELQPGQVGKGGVVRDAALYAVVEQRIRACCATWAWRCRTGLTARSPAVTATVNFLFLQGGRMTAANAPTAGLPVSLEFFPPKTPEGAESCALCASSSMRCGPSSARSRTARGAPPSKAPLTPCAPFCRRGGCSVPLLLHQGHARIGA